MRFVLIRKKRLLAAVLAAAVLIGARQRLPSPAPRRFTTARRCASCPSIGGDGGESGSAVLRRQLGRRQTLEILNILETYDIKANFFIVGFWAEDYAGKLKTLADSGRVEIGTHSNTHPHMPKLSRSQMELELTTSCNIIENVTGKKARSVPRAVRRLFGRAHRNGLFARTVYHSVGRGYARLEGLKSHGNGAARAHQGGQRQYRAHA